MSPENTARTDGRTASPGASPYVSRVAMNPCQAARPFLAERCASKVLRSVSWLTASGECKSPTLIPPSRSVRFSGFLDQLAVHSGGTAPESHRTSLLRPNGHLRTDSRIPQSAAWISSKRQPRRRHESGSRRVRRGVRHGILADLCAVCEPLTREVSKGVSFAPARQGARERSWGTSSHLFEAWPVQSRLMRPRWAGSRGWPTSPLALPELVIPR